MNHNMCGILNLIENDDNLKPLTEGRPIATLPVGCRYRLIDFPLSSMSNMGIDTVAMFIAGSGRSIYDHVRSGKTWDLDRVKGGIFTFSHQTLKQNDLIVQKKPEHFYTDYLDFLVKSGKEYVAVMGSAMFCNLNLQDLLQHHMSKRNEITVVYKNVASEMIDEASDLILSMSEKGNITSITANAEYKREANVEKLPMSMEIYVLKTSKLVEILLAAKERKDIKPFITLLHEAMYEMPARGYEYNGYARVISSVKRYYDANMDLLEVEKFNSLLRGHQRIYTKVKNEAPSFFAKRSFAQKSQFGTGCYIEGSVESSLIFRNVNISQGASVQNSIIMQGSRIGQGARLEYCILDKNVIIGPKVQLKGTKEKPLVIAKNERVFK